MPTRREFLTGLSAAAVTAIGGCAALSGSNDGVVYVASDEKELVALDAGKGRPRWRYSLPDYARTDPIVVDGTDYVGSD